MPVCGLVAILDQDRGRARRAQEALDVHPAITLGDLQGDRLPIVTDTPTLDDDKALWAWLKNQEGILHIDVVYAHLAEEPGADDALEGRVPTP